MNKKYPTEMRLALLLLMWLLPLSNAQSANPEDPYLELFQRSHDIQVEASGLLSQIYQTEHSLLFPQRDLVVIFFSQIQGARIFLHYAELYIDNELIETYKYPMYKVELLAHHRAQQPMFTMLLPQGIHNIRVRIYGLALGGNRFVEAEQIVDKTSQPLFLELNNGFREINVKQWHRP